MPFGLGIWEIVILLGIVALLFGTARVPEIGRKLGRGMREVKDAVADVDPRKMLEDEPPPARKADDATNRG
jgi:sec-independent protein translocase protein TatA